MNVTPPPVLTTATALMFLEALDAFVQMGSLVMELSIVQVNIWEPDTEIVQICPHSEVSIF